MTTREIFVFLGPSLPLPRARSLLSAAFLPPARQADILSLVRNGKPECILLIDGEFGQSLSVWHKEILYALQRGVRVYGASSMGALRAAELYSYGMKGIGRIFEQYRDGDIVGDDEVALTYAPADFGYAPITVPMVNIRASLNEALNAGAISNELSKSVVELTKNIFFADRTRENAIKLLCERGISSKAAELIFGAYFVDQKARDAERALITVKNASVEQAAGVNANCFNRTYTFEIMDEQDRVTRRGLRQREIAKYITLNDPDINKVSANSQAALILGKLFNVRPSPLETEDEKARFIAALRLKKSEDFKRWLEENDLDYERFLALMEESAILRNIHRWFIGARGQKENTKALLDLLKIENDYSSWERKAFNAMEMVKDYSEVLPEDALQVRSLTLDELMLAHANASGWSINGKLDDWIKENCFGSPSDLRNEMTKTVAAEQLSRKFVLGLLEKLNERSKE